MAKHLFCTWSRSSQTFAKNAGTIWPSHEQNEEGAPMKTFHGRRHRREWHGRRKPEGLTIVEPMNVKPISDRERAELVAKTEL